MGANRRGAAVVAAAGMLGLVLAGCGTGQDAPTSLDLPSVPGVNVNAADDSILIRNATVAFSQEGYPAGGEAPVRLWLFNQTDRPIRLIEVTSPGTDEGAASVTTDGEIEIPPGGFVETTLQAGGLRRNLGGAGNLPLTLTFDNGVELFIRVPMAPPLEPLPREPMDLGDGH